MRHIVHSRGNRLFKRMSSADAPQYVQPDAAVNATIRELRAMTLYGLADRLVPVADKWWDKPWQPGEVLTWLSALAEALAVEGLPSNQKAMLRHVHAIVTDWLDEYDNAEQADWLDEKATDGQPLVVEMAGRDE